MKLISVKKSDAKHKKFSAIFEKNGKRKIVNFGDNRYTDFTIGATDEQRKAYRARHATGANAPADTPNALSYHILWNTRSRSKNIEIFKNKYNV
jgi:hypothetical protein|tara:strand:- start:327 stop:608 length:282 start_codon:yes stop_codon:yes gene_type:complete